MSGAAIIAGLSALKSGAGMVTLAVQEQSVNAVRSFLPEVMALSLKDDDPEGSEKVLKDYIKARKIKTVLIGNGLGAGDYQKMLIKSMLFSDNIEKLIIDADGLNNLTEDGRPFENIRKSGKIVIITPHIGEMAFLTGTDIRDVKSRKIECARMVAEKSGAIVNLKDSVSVISDPLGETWLVSNGGPALAKAGSGDVLAGLTAGLAASGYHSMEASLMGAYILGAAGTIFENENSPQTAISRDIIGLFGRVFRDIEGIA